MFVCVLGSAAGGGFPQWNCNCANCQGVRDGSIKATARTQSSIALSDDGQRWVVINTSPDILKQIQQQPLLHPKHGVRHSPIEAVLITDAQVDHVTGLMMLREGCPMDLYCTTEVHSDLTGGLPLLTALEHWNGGFKHHCLPDDESPFQLGGFSGLRFHRVPLESNAPPYSPRRGKPAPGDNIGLYVEDVSTGKSLLYAPGLGVPSEVTHSRMAQADCVMVDGTFWSEDEMSLVGLSHKKAKDMGHMPLSGDGGILSLLKPLKASKKVLIHINNTNPILDEDSKQRRIVEAMDIDIAVDGMVFEV